MQIVNFIINHWSDILLVIIAVASLVYAIYKKDLTLVRKQLFALVTEAEREYGGGTGVLKLASVITAIYPRLPALLKMFVTEKQLTKITEDVLTEAKKKWDSNKKLLEESEGT
ncbi:MAG: hypothetical protein E7536_08970 [Ruminococcaceae bacterium]|nr:hypothetical protein [Oscillospiraceae bacterium]